MFPLGLVGRHCCRCPCSLSPKFGRIPVQPELGMFGDGVNGNDLLIRFSRDCPNHSPSELKRSCNGQGEMQLIFILQS